MSDKDILKFGEEILRSINKAAASGDFSNLSRDIRHSVNGATSSLGASLSSEIRGAVESGLRNALSPQNAQVTPFFSARVNKYTAGIGSLAKTVGGGFIVLIAGIVFLGSILAFGENPGEFGLDIGFVVFSGMALLSGMGLILSALKKSRLIKDFFEFGKIVGKRSYITVKELSDKTGCTAEYVVQRIKLMKNRGYLPYAVLDRDETTLMLTDEVYKEYLKSSAYNAKKQKKASPGKSAEADKKAPEKEKEEKSYKSYYTIDENLPEDVQGILKEGNDYLNEIRYFNDLIPDTEVMSDKLYTMEATALSIFKKLKETPSIARELRKFMSYYLPTTEKLLQSYVDLRKASLTVENIKKSQKEIEEATDVINNAFVELLNQLFESTSWDISSDITAMKVMMKQDALL